MEIADNNEVHPIGIDFCPREKANQTHSQSYVEDLQALSGQKRYAKMARLNLSVLPLFIMSFAGKNFQSVWNNAIDQSILFVNSSAPKPAELSFERFRFSNAVKRMPLHILEQEIDPFQRLLVL